MKFRCHLGEIEVKFRLAEISSEGKIAPAKYVRYNCVSLRGLQTITRARSRTDCQVKSKDRTKVSKR